MSGDVWGENIRDFGAPEEERKWADPRQQHDDEQPAGTAASGRDPSGAVRADVDPYRQLLRLAVASDWEQRLVAEGLASAFRAAYEDAISKLPEVELPEAPTLTSEELEDRVREYAGPPRSSEAFADAVLTAVEEADAFLRELAERPQPVLPLPEASVPRTIRLGALAGFLNECEVNPEWARGRTGTEISNEAYDAILRAREADHERGDPTADIRARAQALTDKLFGFGYEAIAKLQTF
ncbi:MAG: hypothetical protein ACRC20_02965 [Segniliparus sp.]|uniref:hypothetical protein n=1 Tax=Segniliparus sp. TaxID=2804064 RepID=UPI003F380D00